MTKPPQPQQPPPSSWWRLRPQYWAGDPPPPVQVLGPWTRTGAFAGVRVLRSGNVKGSRVYQLDLANFYQQYEPVEDPLGATASGEEKAPLVLPHFLEISHDTWCKLRVLADHYDATALRTTGHRTHLTLGETLEKVADAALALLPAGK